MYSILCCRHSRLLFSCFVLFFNIIVVLLVNLFVKPNQENKRIMINSLKGKQRLHFTEVSHTEFLVMLDKRGNGHLHSYFVLHAKSEPLNIKYLAYKTDLWEFREIAQC